MALFRPIPFAHNLLENHLSDASYVIDATVGNGHDALFISNILEKNGKLFGFDVQASAIKNTKEKLGETSCQTALFQTSHHKMFQTLSQYENAIDAIIFNLGFLPHGEEKLTTLWHTTYRAIIQAFALLRYKGLLIIVTYPGHTEGAFEDTQLKKLLYAQNKEQYYISTYQQIGKDIHSPIVYAIEKRCHL